MAGPSFTVLSSYIAPSPSGAILSHPFLICSGNVLINLLRNFLLRDTFIHTVLLLVFFKTSSSAILLTKWRQIWQLIFDIHTASSQSLDLSRFRLLMLESYQISLVRISINVYSDKQAFVITINLNCQIFSVFCLKREVKYNFFIILNKISIT